MDLYRTDYSTLNRVFGWNIGIRCRKPTQTYRGTPAWAEGFGPPAFCCSIFVFSLMFPEAMPWQRDAAIRHRLENVENFSLLLEAPRIRRRACVPSLSFANEFRNFALVNEFLIFSLKSMSTDWPHHCGISRPGKDPPSILIYFSAESGLFPSVNYKFLL